MKNTLATLETKAISKRDAASYSVYTNCKEIYLQEVGKAKRQVNETFITSTSHPQKAVWDIIKAETSYKKKSQRSDKLSATSLCNYFSNLAI